MKLLVIFGKPYFQVTEEEGESETQCIKKALAKFNRNFLGGYTTIEDTIEDMAEMNSTRKDGDFRSIFNGYTWDIKTYDGKHIKDENTTLFKIRYDIEAITVEKSNALVKEDKLAKYKRLKEELGL